MTTYSSLFEGHKSILWAEYRSITIGASDDHMEVHLPPESADIQTAPVIDFVATEDIENLLWASGFKTKLGNLYTEILEVKRKKLTTNSGRKPIVYCYSVLFGDGIEEKHYDDVRGHFRGADFKVKSFF